MFRFTQFAALFATALWCTQGCSDQAAVNVSARSQDQSASSPYGTLPMFDAPKTEALLQPNSLFPQGTYANREFGCCTPRHLGHDFKASAGTPVLALAPGMVLPSPISGPHCGYGNIVAIWSKLMDGTDFVIIYGHLSGREGMEPTLSGPVERGDVIGYIGHSGGISPSGDRCGDDDENGDGAEHLHIGLRFGPPPTGQGNALRWAYYGYAGNGEDVDIDAQGIRRYGKFSSIVRFAECHGTHAGLTPNGTWLAQSSDMQDAYCHKGGYTTFGDSEDFGQGNGMTMWGGTFCQHFRRHNSPIVDSLSICLNPSMEQAFTVPWPVWSAFQIPTLTSQLGAPTNEPEPLPTGLWKQTFQNGTVTYAPNQEQETHIRLHSGANYTLQNGTLLGPTVTDPEFGNSSSTSSSSSSSSGGIPTSSSTASSSSAPEASSSSSATQPTHDPNTQDPPYTTCGRFGFNKVVNGDFNLDPLACGWTLENHLGGSHAVQICTPDGACFAKLWTTTPNDPWQSQLKQYVHIYQGKKYLFRFKTKASYADRLIVQLMKEDSPWTNYGLWLDTEVPAGIEQEFAIEFRATATDTYARLTFQFGQTQTSFTVDKVWLEELPE